MRPRSLLFVSLAVVTMAGVSLPAVADAAQQRPRTAPVRAVTPRALDFTNHGPSVAMQAAQAAQAGTLPGSSATPGAAVAVETPTSAPAGTVSGLTVTPDTPRQGKVIASTDATSLTSPNFSVADAADKPLSVSLGNNTAAGKLSVDNRPAAAAGGLLANNPDLLGAQPVRSDVGVVKAF